MDDLTRRIESVLPLDKLLLQGDDMNDTVSLKLAQLKLRGMKYAHLDSTAFRKVPAYLTEKEGRLKVNTQNSWMLAEEDDFEIDSDEELAREEVDQIMGLKNFSNIDDMIEDNKKRHELIEIALERIKRDKRGAKVPFAYRTCEYQDSHLPDASQMFNVLSASNKEIQSVQAAYLQYLRSLVDRAQMIRQILSK